MSTKRALWKANIIAFISSFCVMVIELVASRILAPTIGVSLYTWTSIIGVILGGIALGNFLGGRVADRYASPRVLATVFFTGALGTVWVLPAVKWVSGIGWFGNLPVMLDFILKVCCTFLLPAVILSMVSPIVIKLTLSDLGKTGGTVGTIYAFSTVGSILGTFMTGFYFILWFGTRTAVWLVAGCLFLTGIISWLAWRVPERWKLERRNVAVGAVMIIVAVTSLWLLSNGENWRVDYTRESNYYAINVTDEDNVKVLALDHLIHSYVTLDDPLAMKYDYLKVFADIIGYVNGKDNGMRVLHLGGGGYSLPRYLSTVYRSSINEVAEVDPAVTSVAYEYLGLPRDTPIKTYNQDARLFLLKRQSPEKYDFVVGDVFNDLATPYHLTTLEFDKLVKANMKDDGVYMVNIIDSYDRGRYMPSFIYTLRQVFKNVYLFGLLSDLPSCGTSTFVIAATDNPISFDQYWSSAANGELHGYPFGASTLDGYLAQRDYILLTDDHVPTDIFVAQVRH